MEIEYGYDAVMENIRESLLEFGLDSDMYLEVFGYPDEYKDMKIDPLWFTPSLPGMEKHTDSVSTMAEAEDLLDTKKHEAFLASIGSDGYKALTEEEYETWSQNDELTSLRFEDISQFMYEDLKESIDIAIEGYKEWNVVGSNLSWRGDGGSKTLTLEDSSDVLNILTGYGDCTIKLYVNDQSNEGEFKITCYHHDCPMGSVFEFTPIKEE